MAFQVLKCPTVCSQDILPSAIFISQVLVYPTPFSRYPNLRLFCIPGFNMYYCLFSRFSNLCRFVFQVFECPNVCSQDFLTSACFVFRALICPTVCSQDSLTSACFVFQVLKCSTVCSQDYLIWSCLIFKVLKISSCLFSMLSNPILFGIQGFKIFFSLVSRFPNCFTFQVLSCPALFSGFPHLILFLFHVFKPISQGFLTWSCFFLYIFKMVYTLFSGFSTWSCFVLRFQNFLLSILNVSQRAPLGIPGFKMSFCLFQGFALQVSKGRLSMFPNLLLF